ncbi:hypothetical protein ACFSCZ_13430 [Siminovitchia sediminis]|uniref:Uncharacterized protein n=1 Tax=Siminovitchia sediminis TaxID=1274353 RepID=A0ABW4KKL6_9BACI
MNVKRMLKLFLSALVLLLATACGGGEDVPAQEDPADAPMEQTNTEEPAGDMNEEPSSGNMEEPAEDMSGEPSSGETNMEEPADPVDETETDEPLDDSGETN